MPGMHSPSPVYLTDSAGNTAAALEIQGSGVTYTNRSGTITAGATAQTLMAANADRRGLWIQNLSSGDLWISSLGTAAATQPSMKLTAGSLYEAPAHGVPVAAISIFGATTGQAFSAREW
jgi:hypothetical protein